MREFVIGRGREDDREGMLLAEESDARVEVRDVHKTVRLQANASISFEIPAHGDFVGDGAVEEFPRHRRNFLFRERLEIGERDNLLIGFGGLQRGFRGGDFGCRRGR